MDSETPITNNNSNNNNKYGIIKIKIKFAHVRVHALMKILKKTILWIFYKNS